MAHIAYVNIAHIKTSQYNLFQYTEETSPHVFLLSETHEQPNNPPCFIQGYTPITRHTNENGTGGTAIYAKNGITCNKIDTSKFAENVSAITINIPTMGTVAIITHYIPPNPNSKIRKKIFSEFTRKYNHCLFMGDYNAHHPFINSNRPNTRGQNLYKILQSEELDLINADGQHTRIDLAHGSSSLLDLVITTPQLSAKITNLEIGSDVGSDHLPLHLHIGDSHPEFTNPTPVRNIKKTNWDIFKKDLADSFSKLGPIKITNENHADQLVDNVHNLIEQGLNCACPVSLIKKRQIEFDPATVQLIKLKRQARRRLQRNPSCPILLNIYKDLRSQADKAVKELKRRYWAKACEKLNNNDVSEFWRNFKRLSGRSSKPRKLTINNSNGEKLTENKDIADAFANHLKNVHRINQSPDFDENHFNNISTFIKQNNHLFKPKFNITEEEGDDNFLIAPHTPTSLLNILNKTRNSAPGEDKIPYLILKNLPNEALTYIASLYHNLLHCGYFPSLWKSAIGVMIPKPNKDLNNPSNYRPISLIRCLGKLFEKTIASPLIDHLIGNNIINKWQRAYLPGMEANEHVHRLTHEAYHALKNGWSTAAIFLDVEKAFDSVWQDGLRYKIYKLELPKKLTRILSSFLQDRQIAVRCEEIISDHVELLAGTPQGSVLSPTLFNIYVNDIPFSNDAQIQISQYADDLAIWSSHRGSRRPKSTWNRIYLDLKRALHLLEKWCNTWRIKLNANKTELKVFTRGKPSASTLTLFNSPIHISTNEVKFLGLIMDKQKLNLTTHCKTKRAEAERRIGLLRTLRGTDWGASTRSLLRLYKSFIRPVLETGYIATHLGNHYAINQLQIAQNKALRVCLKIKYIPGTSRITNAELHERAKIPTIENRLNYLATRAIKRYSESTLTKELNLKIEKFKSLQYQYPSDKKKNTVQ